MEKNGVKYIIEKTESKILIIPLEDNKTDRDLEYLSAYFNSDDLIETVRLSLHMLHSMLDN